MQTAGGFSGNGLYHKMSINAISRKSIAKCGVLGVEEAA